jgi:hypothetical protein
MNELLTASFEPEPPNQHLQLTKARFSAAATALYL